MLLENQEFPCNRAPLAAHIAGNLILIQEVLLKYTHHNEDAQMGARALVGVIFVMMHLADQGPLLVPAADSVGDL